MAWFVFVRALVMVVHTHTHAHTHTHTHTHVKTKVHGRNLQVLRKGHKSAKVWTKPLHLHLGKSSSEMPPPKEVSQPLKLVPEDVWASDRLWEGQRRGACRGRDDWIKVCRWREDDAAWSGSVREQVCVWVCEYMWLCVCVWICMFVCLSALDCVFECVRQRVYVWICVVVCLSVWDCVCVWVCETVCVCLNMCGCMFECVRLCVCVLGGWVIQGRRRGDEIGGIIEPIMEPLDGLAPKNCLWVFC